MLREGITIDLLEHRVELGRELLAEHRGGVVDLADGELDRGERREHLLDESLAVKDVAIHDELEAALRRAECLQRGLLRGGAGTVRELAVKVCDLLHLGRVREGERSEEVALVDDGSGLLLVGELAALGGLDGDNHLHRLRLREWLAHLDVGAILDEVTDNLARYVGAQLRGVVEGGQQDGHAVEDHAQTEGLLLGEELERARGVVGGGGGGGVSTHSMGVEARALSCGGAHSMCVWRVGVRVKCCRLVGEALQVGAQSAVTYLVALVTVTDVEAAVGLLAEADVDLLLAEFEGHRVGRLRGGGERVFGVEVRDLDGDGLHLAQGESGELAL